MAAGAAGLRPVRADGTPPLHRMEPGSCMAQTPPPGPGRARRQRRTGLVAVRHRFGEHAGDERGDLTGPNPRRSRQERIKDPLDHRAGRSAPLDRYLRREHARQPGTRTPGTGHTSHPFPARPPPTAARQAPWRQGLRLRPPAEMAPLAKHHPAPRPQKHRVLPEAGPPPVGPWSERWRGCLGAAAYTAATSARPSTSWPSPVSRSP